MRRGYFSLGVGDLLSPKGRIDRLTMFMYLAGLTIASYAINAAILLIESTIGQTVPGYLTESFDFIRIAISLVFVYAFFCIYSKRLHDLGLPSILALLAIASSVLPICLIFAKHFPALQFPTGDNLDKSVFFLGGLRTVFQLSLFLIPGRKGTNRYGATSLGEDRPRPHVLEG